MREFRPGSSSVLALLSLPRGTQLLWRIQQSLRRTRRGCNPSGFAYLPEIRDSPFQSPFDIQRRSFIRDAHRVLPVAVLLVDHNGRARLGTLQPPAEPVLEVFGNQGCGCRRADVLHEERGQSYDVKMQRNLFIVSVLRCYLDYGATRHALAKKVQEVHGPLWKHRALILAKTVIGDQND